MARRPGIPQRPGDISADWLRQALAYAGAFDPEQLRVVSIEPVGAGRGLLSTVVRCRLAWCADAPQRPRSVIVKIHSQDRKTFRLARVIKLYLREYDFYRRIRPLAGIRTPELLYADFAPFSHRFVMVLEDLGGLQSTAQADGASQVQARRAIRALARMHGRYWNNVNQPCYERRAGLHEKIPTPGSAWLHVQPGARPPTGLETGSLPECVVSPKPTAPGLPIT